MDDEERLALVEAAVAAASAVEDPAALAHDLGRDTERLLSLPQTMSEMVSALVLAAGCAAGIAAGSAVA